MHVNTPVWTDLSWPTVDNNFYLLGMILTMVVVRSYNYVFTIALL